MIYDLLKWWPVASVVVGVLAWAFVRGAELLNRDMNDLGEESSRE